MSEYFEKELKKLIVKTLKKEQNKGETAISSASEITFILYHTFLQQKAAVEFILKENNDKKGFGLYQDVLTEISMNAEKTNKSAVEKIFKSQSQN